MPSQAMIKLIYTQHTIFYYTKSAEHLFLYIILQSVSGKLNSFLLFCCFS